MKKQDQPKKVERHPQGNTGKKTRISHTLLLRLSIATVLVNFVLLCIIGTTAKMMFRSSQEEYLLEINNNITTTIEQTMESFLSVTRVLAQNDNIITILEESDQRNPMHENPLADTVAKEMNKVAMLYPGDVVYTAILDIEQDGYLLSSGGYSDSSFSFQTRPYYAAVTTKAAYVTEPYLDTETGTLVVSVCYPVFSDNGTILGIVLLDLSTSFVSQLVLNSSFGDSGHSVILDNQNNIIASEETSAIGGSYTTLNISGSSLDSELSNPTGKLVEYDRNNVGEIGTTAHVGDYGWKILTGMNYREYDSNVTEILRLLLSTMVISAIVVVLMAFYNVKSSLKPLAEIKEAMHQLATGNTSYEFD